MSIVIRFVHLTGLIGLILCLAATSDGKKPSKGLKPRANLNQGFEVIGKDTYELVQMRGFIAENHYVQTQGGYKVNLVKILNPAINGGQSGAPGKAPILVIHGVFLSAACFVMDSENVHPVDLSHLSISTMTDEQIKLLEDEPMSKSFPFMMSNFGHEVWLMNRRPSLESMKGSRVGGKSNAPPSGEIGTFGHLKKLYLSNMKKILDFGNFDKITKKGSGLSSVVTSIQRALGPGLNDSLNLNALNRHYWNYSLDEQADYDMPAVIDYVFERSNNTPINTIGYSAGGSLVLMMLSQNSRVNEKMSNVILWAPAMDLGYTTEVNHFMSICMKFDWLWRRWAGALTPATILPYLQVTTSLLCAMNKIQEKACHSFVNAFLGPGVDQLNIPGGFYDVLFQSIAPKEIVSFDQTFKYGRMQRFNYGNKRQNMIAYGTVDPPFYYMENITKKELYFFGGNTDILVTPKNIDLMLSHLSFKAEHKIIGDDEVKFNHLAFFMHCNSSNLLNIPTARIISKDDKYFNAIVPLWSLAKSLIPDIHLPRILK